MPPQGPPPNPAEFDSSHESLGAATREVIGKIVMYNPNHYLNDESDSPTQGHMQLDDQIVEDGKTKANFWLPVEAKNPNPHVVAHSAGVAFDGLENPRKDELYFITPAGEILSGEDLSALPPGDQQALLDRIKKIGKELGTPGIR